MKKDPIYNLENVPVFEAIYGKGLISLGGFPAFEKMFEGISLKEKHLLDIGFGIGGADCFLIKKYGAFVSGVEVHPWMVDYANSIAPIELRSKLKFMVYKEDGSIPLPSKSVDIAFSKGVLTNVEDKKSLFKEIARVLKKDGELCLIDWLVDGEARVELLPLGDISYKESETSYRELLESCGFVNIAFEDRNAEYLQYVKDLDVLLSSEEHTQQFRDVLSDKLRSDVLDSNRKLMQSIFDRKQFSTRIRASLT